MRKFGGYVRDLSKLKTSCYCLILITFHTSKISNYCCLQLIRLYHPYILKNPKLNIHNEVSTSIRFSISPLLPYVLVFALLVSISFFCA